MHELTRARWL